MRVFLTSRGSLDLAMYETNGFTVTDRMKDADFVHFRGGPDVDPELYGEAPLKETTFDPNRDKVDKEMFITARQMGKPMVGVCRGGQFLNVMCGGRMYQDVDNHRTEHKMVDTRTGESFLVTSTHHQMMRPTDAAVILGVASVAENFRYMHKGYVCRYKPQVGEDIEAVWYGKQRCLCYQPHPEYLANDTKCVKNFFSLIEEYVLCVD